MPGFRYPPQLIKECSLLPSQTFQWTTCPGVSSKALSSVTLLTERAGLSRSMLHQTSWLQRIYKWVLMDVRSPGQPLLPYDISSQGLCLPGAKVIASKMSSDQKCTPSVPQAKKNNNNNRYTTAYEHRWTVYGIMTLPTVIIYIRIMHKSHDSVRYSTNITYLC